jgi:secreted Zn-dependent insulinase-like peptidase
VSVRLSEEGLKHYDTIVTLIYEAIHLIEQTFTHNETYLEQIWQELKTIQDINFKFQDRSSGYDMAQSIVENMVRYPKEHVFSAGYTLDGMYDRPMLREALNRMTPEQGVLLLKSSDYTWLPEDISDLDPYSEPAVSILKNQDDILRLFPSSMSSDNNSSSALVPNRVESFYGIPYRQDPFPVHALSQWSAAREHGAASVGELESAVTTSSSLGLPEFNPYVSKDLTLNANGSSPTSLSSFRGLIRSAFPVQIVSSFDSSTHTNKNDLHSNSNKNIMVTATSSLWLSRDELFGLPKAAITCFLHNPYCGKLVFLFNIKF